MSRYKNDAALKLIGKKIHDLRVKNELEIEDVAQMTGFTFNTINNIENGNETFLSYFIEVCLALGMHPKNVIAINIDIKPRFKHSPDRKEKSRLTQRIRSLINSGFFKSSKSTKEVAEKLKEKYDFNAPSKNLSSILKRHLKVNKKGNRNYYSED